MNTATTLIVERDGKQSKPVRLSRPYSLGELRDLFAIKCAHPIFHLSGQVVTAIL